MFYTVYRTTNSVSGRYYFGVHKTEDPNAGYLGSSSYIRAAIAKHGEAALSKDVLFVYANSESAFGKEDELIQAYRGLDPLCMNLRRGGSGGFDWINGRGLNNSNGNWRKGVQAASRLVASSQERKTALVSMARWARMFRTDAHRKRVIAMNLARIGTHRTLAEKASISRGHMGSMNGQFGKKWVYHPVLRSSKPVGASELGSLLGEGWVLGRKMKF